VLSVASGRRPLAGSPSSAELARCRGTTAEDDALGSDWLARRAAVLRTLLRACRVRVREITAPERVLSENGQRE